MKRRKERDREVMAKFQDGGQTLVDISLEFQSFS